MKVGVTTLTIQVNLYRTARRETTIFAVVATNKTMLANCTFPVRVGVYHNTVINFVCHYIPLYSSVTAPLAASTTSFSISAKLKSHLSMVTSRRL